MAAQDTQSESGTIPTQSRAPELLVAPRFRSLPLTVPPAVNDGGTSNSMPPSEHETKAVRVKAEACEDSGHLTKASEHTKNEAHNEMEDTKMEDVGTDDTRETWPSVHDVTFDHLRAAMQSTSPDLLEQHFYVARDIAEQLLQHLSELKDTNTAVLRLVRSITELLGQGEPSRTVIGVLGNTGSGKSSTINALLGEHKLLPTNCMRACTAVPTEVTWNPSDDPAERYRAHVEFISQEAWRNELQHLFLEVRDENGVPNPDIRHSGTDASVAWAKIKSVYPHYTKETLGSIKDVDQLVAEPAVKHLLGSVKTVKSGSAEEFQQLVQAYVDSKDAVTGKRIKTGGGARTPTELWPLIQRVRIYSKAEVLSKGVVLVDLPGCGDSNEARSTVASKYQENCTRLWIVAPITRAVDDKVAQKLLGDSFKMQLKYDGAYSNITFICTKTDEIDFTEAVNSLQLEDEVGQFNSKRQALGQELEALAREEAQSREDLSKARASKQQVTNDLTTWKALRDRCRQGQTVFPPIEKPQAAKRKPCSAPAAEPPRKTPAFPGGRVMRSRPPPMLIVEDDEEEDEDSTPGEESVGQTALTLDEIDSRIQELITRKKGLASECQTLVRFINEQTLTKCLKQEERLAIDANFNAMCVKQRNEFSCSTIKDHFARGVRELDMEAADEEDEDDDAVAARAEKGKKYDDLAKSLAVFCTSSRAYMQMSTAADAGSGSDIHMGPASAATDSIPKGFVTLEDTQIPQLRAHAMDLTVNPRIANCRKSLNGLLTVMQSAMAWLRGQGKQIVWVEPEAGKVEALEKRLEQLKLNLQHAAKKTKDDLGNNFTKHLFTISSSQANRAAKEVMPIIEGWGKPRKDGGYAYSTYRAVCRQNGRYGRKDRDTIDFNEEIARVVMRHLGNGWERAFNNTDLILGAFGRTAKACLEAFHHATLESFPDQKNGSAFARIQLLAPQLQAYIQGIDESLVNHQEAIQAVRCEAWRQFTPSVQTKMKPGYKAACQEKGKGCFVLMKDHVVGQAAQLGPKLYKSGLNDMQKTLREHCAQLERDMNAAVQSTVENMSSDYINSISRLEVPTIPEEVARPVMQILRGADAQFGAQSAGAAGSGADGTVG